MKTITIAVPDEALKSLETFLYQSNITVIEEKEEEEELVIFELEETEETDEHINLEEIEKELEEEIWKLHHFGE